MENSASQQVLALVLLRLGDAEFNPVSDRALGRCLGTSHTQAARLRKGEYPLDFRTFTRALRYLDLPADQMMELKLSYEAEASGDEGTIEWMIGKLQELQREDVAKRFFRKTDKVASLGAAAILALLSMHAEPARAGVSVEPASERVIHYATLRRRRFRRRATDRMLPLLDPLQGFRTGFTARQRATA